MQTTNIGSLKNFLGTLSNNQDLDKVLAFNTNQFYTDDQLRKTTQNELLNQKAFIQSELQHTRRITKDTTVELAVARLLKQGMSIVKIDDIANHMISKSAARKGMLEFASRPNKYLSGITVQMIGHDTYKIKTGVAGKENVVYYPDMSTTDFIQAVAKECKTTDQHILACLFADKSEVKEIPETLAKRQVGVIRNYLISGSKVLQSVSFALWAQRRYLNGQTRFAKNELNRYGFTMHVTASSPLKYLNQFAGLSIRKLDHEYEIYDKQEVKTILRELVNVPDVYNRINQQIEFFENLKVSQSDLEIKLGMNSGELAETMEIEDYQPLLLKQLTYLSNTYGTRKVPHNISFMMRAERIVDYGHIPYLDLHSLDQDIQDMVTTKNVSGYRNDIQFHYDKTKKLYEIVQITDDQYFKQTYDPNAMEKDNRWRIDIGDFIVRKSNLEVYQVLQTILGPNRTKQIVIRDDTEEYVLNPSEYMEYHEMAKLHTDISDCIVKKEDEIYGRVSA